MASAELIRQLVATEIRVVLPGADMGVEEAAAGGGRLWVGQGEEAKIWLLLERRGDQQEWNKGEKAAVSTLRLEARWEDASGAQTDIFERKPRHGPVRREEDEKDEENRVRLQGGWEARVEGRWTVIELCVPVQIRKEIPKVHLVLRARTAAFGDELSLLGYQNVAERKTVEAEGRLENIEIRSLLKCSIESRNQTGFEQFIALEGQHECGVKIERIYIAEGSCVNSSSNGPVELSRFFSTQICFEQVSLFNGEVESCFIRFSPRPAIYGIAESFSAKLVIQFSASDLLGKVESNLVLQWSTPLNLGGLRVTTFQETIGKVGEIILLTVRITNLLNKERFLVLEAPAPLNCAVQSLDGSFALDRLGNQISALFITKSLNP